MNKKLLHAYERLIANDERRTTNLDNLKPHELNASASTSRSSSRARPITNQVRNTKFKLPYTCNTNIPSLYKQVTKMSNIFDFLKSAFAKIGPDDVHGSKPSTARHFVPKKRLREVDAIIIAMLNSNGHEDTCYCICDPDMDDSPIIFASDG